MVTVPSIFGAFETQVVKLIDIHMTTICRRRKFCHKLKLGTRNKSKYHPFVTRKNEKHEVKFYDRIQCKLKTLEKYRTYTVTLYES